MSDTARDDYRTIEPVSTEGLEEIFDVQVAVAGPNMAEGQQVSLVEAAEKLGITRRSALRLIQQGKLAGAKEGQGQWFVSMRSIVDRLQAKNVSASDIQHVALEVAEGHGQAWPEGQEKGHLEMIKELQTKIEALTYRTGYLQSQLLERESDLAARDQQIRLLTDSQHKPDRWQRFRSWFLASSFRKKIRL
jgi:hypothetical protein